MTRPGDHHHNPGLVGSIRNCQVLIFPKLKKLRKKWKKIHGYQPDQGCDDDPLAVSLPPKRTPVMKPSPLHTLSNPKANQTIICSDKPLIFKKQLWGYQIVTKRNINSNDRYLTINYVCVKTIKFKQQKINHFIIIAKWPSSILSFIFGQNLGVEKHNFKRFGWISNKRVA